MKNLCLILLTAFSLSLIGCVTQSPIQTSPDLNTPTVIHKVNKENQLKAKLNIPRVKQCRATQTEIAECKVKGGEIVESGIMGCDRCIVKYADAGKTCQDSSECMGDCVVTDDKEIFGKSNLKGHCSATSSPFGCHARIEHGKSLGVMCVD